MKVVLMEANPQTIVSGSTPLAATLIPQELTTGSLQMNQAQNPSKQEKMDVSSSDSKRIVKATAENGAMTSVSNLVVSGSLWKRQTEAPEGRHAQTIQTTPMELGRQ